MTHPTAAVEAATPSAKWRTNGETDPHGSRYDCERAKLAKGHLTDDELANGIFMASRNDLDLISWQQAAKDRIRWLSRALDQAEADKAAAVDAERAACTDEMRLALAAAGALRATP